MNLVFKNTFLKDIKKLKSPATKLLIEEVIFECHQANRIADIKHCTPLISKSKFF